MWDNKQQGLASCLSCLILYLLTFKASFNGVTLIKNIAIPFSPTSLGANVFSLPFGLLAWPCCFCDKIVGQMQKCSSWGSSLYQRKGAFGSNPMGGWIQKLYTVMVCSRTGMGDPGTAVVKLGHHDTPARSSPAAFPFRGRAGEWQWCNCYDCIVSARIMDLGGLTTACPSVREGWGALLKKIFNYCDPLPVLQ